MEIINNTKLSRFELNIDGKTAVVDYILRNNVYTIPRVYVPKELEGQGIGTKVLKASLDIIENEGAKIIPVCPFVSVYLDRHPERKSLLA